MHLHALLIGYDKSKCGWMQYCTLEWEKNIITISKTVGKFPQESYFAVAHVIQLEWIFLQRVKKNMGYVFAGVKKVIWENFLPRLFFGKSKSLPSIVGTLSTMPVNKSVLDLQKLVMAADKKIHNLQRASKELIRALTGESKFSIADRLKALRGEVMKARKPSMTSTISN